MAIKLNSMTEQEIESIAEARCFRFRFRKIIGNGRLKSK